MHRNANTKSDAQAPALPRPHSIPGAGVHLAGGSSRALLERNYVERTGFGFNLGFDTDTEYFDTAANPTLYESINATARNNILVGISMVCGCVCCCLMAQSGCLAGRGGACKLHAILSKLFHSAPTRRQRTSIHPASSDSANLPHRTHPIIPAHRPASTCGQDTAPSLRTTRCGTHRPRPRPPSFWRPPRATAAQSRPAPTQWCGATCWLGSPQRGRDPCSRSERAVWIQVWATAPR